MFEIKEEIISDVSPRVCDATQKRETKRALQKEPRLLAKKSSVTSEYLVWQYPKGLLRIMGNLGQVQTKLQLEHTRQEDLLHSLFHHLHQLENKNRPNRTQLLT